MMVMVQVSRGKRVERGKAGTLAQQEPAGTPHTHPPNTLPFPQMPTPPGYFGNAVRMLEVSLPANTQQPADGDWVAALARLAGAIRRATAAFRSEPVRRRLCMHAAVWLLFRQQPGLPAGGKSCSSLRCTMQSC